jgi:linker histone H1 and H5 family.
MSLLEQIIEAINFFREVNGSTLSKITKYIKINYGPFDDAKGDLKARVQKELKENMKKGVIIYRARRYKLNTVGSDVPDCGLWRKLMDVCGLTRYQKKDKGKCRLMGNTIRKSRRGRRKIRARRKSKCGLRKVRASRKRKYGLRKVRASRKSKCGLRKERENRKSSKQRCEVRKTKTSISTKSKGRSVRKTRGEKKKDKCSEIIDKYMSQHQLGSTDKIHEKDETCDPLEIVVVFDKE